MTYTIDLTPEQETYLREMAAQRGQTPEEYALELIMKALEDEELGESAEEAGSQPPQT